METIVLVLNDSAVVLEDIAAALEPAYDIVRTGAVVSVVEGVEACHVVQVVDAEADGVFEDWPAEILPREPVAIFSVDYRAPKLAVAVVRRLAGWRQLVVDTNYGDIVSSSALTEDLLRAGREGVE